MTRILLIDASPTVRALARLALQDAGVELLLAGGGDEALAMVRAHRPDVAVVDAMLSDVDPFELCRRLREGAPRLALVLSAPDYLALDPTLLAHTGIRATLAKPFDRQSLLDVIAAESAPAQAATATPTPAPTAGPSVGRDLASGLSGDDLARQASAALLPDLQERVRALLAAELEPWVRQEVATAVRAYLPDALREAREIIEPVVWKTVPSLAEQFIKEELARLTEELEEP